MDAFRESWPMGVLMDKDGVESVHDRPELEAGIKRWDESGYTCAPAISGRTLEDGHRLSCVLTMVGGVHDVRMSCPIDGRMASTDAGVFTCSHGEFDAMDLMGCTPRPGVDLISWPTMDWTSAEWRASDWRH